MSFVTIVRSLALAAAIVPAAAWAGCLFTFTGCDTEDCGTGCTVYAYGPNNYYCTNGTHTPECCACVQYEIFCHCELGNGTGWGSNHYDMHNSTCGGGKCTPSG